MIIAESATLRTKSVTLAEKAMRKLEARHFAEAEPGGLRKWKEEDSRANNARASHFASVRLSGEPNGTGRVLG